MNKKEINVKTLLIEVAKCFFIKEEITKEELKARCGYQLNDNHINDLLHNNILVGNNTRPRKYKLAVKPMHILSHVNSYVVMYNTCKVQKERIIAKRQATIKDCLSEIHRLKEILKENHIKF